MNRVILFALLVVGLIATDQYFKAGDSVSGLADSSKSGTEMNTPSSSRQSDAPFANMPSYHSQQAAVTEDVSHDPAFCSADTLVCDFETAAEPLIIGEYVAVDDLTQWQVDAEPMSVGEYISMEELALSESKEEMIVGEFFDVNDYLNESKEPMSVGEELDIDEWISQREYSQD